MDLKEEILSQYETYVTMKQPHNTTPIFLKENVLEAMERYAEAKIKQITSEGKPINSDNTNCAIFDVIGNILGFLVVARSGLFVRNAVGILILTLSAVCLVNTVY